MVASSKQRQLTQLVSLVNLPIRLFSFLPGRRLEEIGYSPAIYRKVGETLARFHNVTGNFDRPVFHTHYPPIAIENWDGLEDEFQLLREKGMIQPARAELCAPVFKEVREKLLAKKHEFEQGKQRARQS